MALFMTPGTANFNPRSPYGERHISVCINTSHSNFNPRSPYGERPVFANIGEQAIKFQSTLPIRGATL